MGIDIATGRKPSIAIPEEEIVATEERCLLSFALAIQTMECLRGVSPPQQQRLKLAAASLDLAFEHHAAIARLSSLGHYGSANALLRPLIEAVIAALWLAYCASDHQAASLEQGSFTTNIDKMSNQLTRKLGKRLQRLKDMLRDELGKIFHGFTHGGMDQLRWRVPFAGEGNNHGYRQIVSTLIISDISMVNGIDAASAIYGSVVLRDFADKWIGQVVSEAQSVLEMPYEPLHWDHLPPVPK
jgi:hypothetical protein